ncbi:MAG: hypothetical protein ACP59X_09905 [Solidesulfovibrio sp. DCME]|uniref:hypothetical protein n=1 Tax=Solidesulfovibrio sp. DCME TaxID=3447380 RepID=UPI003D09CAD0
MRRILGLLCVVAMSWALSGCTGLGVLAAKMTASTIGPAAADVGPDAAPPADAGSADTDAELSSGLEWLWSSVVGLKSKLAVVAAVAPNAAAVIEKRLETARELIAHVEAVARQGSVDDAKTLWRQARDAIGTVADLVQGLAVTSAAGM